MLTVIGAIAKEQGKFKSGQLKTIDEPLFKETYEEYESRKINKTQMANKLKISRPTLNKLLKDKCLI